MKFKNKKSLGQNFLIDKNILKIITDVGKISKNDKVIEVGPGNGNLTQYLINKNPKYLKIIEKDKELIKLLSNKFKDQIEIFHNDILKVNEDFYEDGVIIYGNLPYNISTKILANWCLSKKIKFKKLILMFQKEVADRIIAQPNSSKYGRISIISSWKMNVKKIQEINPFSFYPAPKVKSAILVFEPKKNFYKIKDCKNLEYVTQVFFNFRRKKIKKSLNILFGNYEKISKKLNIDFNKRPENLEPDTYLRLCTEYEKII